MPMIQRLSHINSIGYYLKRFSLQPQGNNLSFLKLCDTFRVQLRKWKFILKELTYF